MKGFLILGLILMLLLANAPVLAQNTVRLSIATGGTGGIYYPMGSGLAGLITKYVPNVHVTAEITGGSIDNCLVLNDGKADLALSVADTAWNAYQGKGKRFRERVPLRTMAAIYPIFMHLVALGGGNIEKVTDLKEKVFNKYDYRVKFEINGAGSGFDSLKLKSVDLVIDSSIAKRQWQIDQIWASRPVARPGETVEVFVSMAGEDGAEFAKGNPNYNSGELHNIKGLQAAQVKKKLGKEKPSEVIERRNIHLIEG